ncbi:MAG: hypothetical protein ACN4GW_05885 [Desulforhopalus sp.]
MGSPRKNLKGEKVGGTTLTMVGIKAENQGDLDHFRTSAYGV